MKFPSSKNYPELLRVTVESTGEGFEIVNKFIGEFVDDDYPDADRSNKLHWLPEQELNGKLFLSHFLSENGIEMLLFKSHPRFEELRDKLMEYFSE